MAVKTLSDYYWSLQVQDTIKKASALGLPSPLQPPPPLASSFLPPPLSATWNLSGNSRTGSNIIIYF